VTYAYEFRIMGRYGTWGEGAESPYPDIRDDPWSNWLMEDLEHAQSRYPEDPDHFKIQRRTVGEWETLSLEQRVVGVGEVDGDVGSGQVQSDEGLDGLPAPSAETSSDLGHVD
jgi:hypothetical protein